MKTNEENVTIYVTKYALTKGIMEMQATIPHHISSDMACVRETPGSLGQNFHRDEWHRDMESARAHANKMVQDRITSLEKSIKKVRCLKF